MKGAPASLASSAQHRAQVASNNLLRVRHHALDDLGSRQDRVNQSGVLANENRGIVHIACEARGPCRCTDGAGLLA
jgi:hypothetical protein